MSPASDINKALWAGWGFAGVIIIGWAGWITTAVIGNQTAIVKLTETQQNEQVNIRERLEYIRESVTDLKQMVMQQCTPTGVAASQK